MDCGDLEVDIQPAEALFRSHRDDGGRVLGIGEAASEGPITIRLRAATC
jgi:hypothetical protein